MPGLAVACIRLDWTSKTSALRPNSLASQCAWHAFCVQPNHAVHGQGGTVKKLPSPAAVASAIPEALAPATPVTVSEKGKTAHERRACVTAVFEERIKDNREDLVNALLMTAAGTGFHLTRIFCS